MDVVVVKNIQGGFASEMSVQQANVYERGIVFYRSGPESDRLVAALATLYGRDCRQVVRMTAEESFTAIALHQGALDVERDPVRIKMFGRDTESFDDDAYYESFFNLDLAGGFVCWNEKDPDYRGPLISALAE